jgi:hypothetical protein
MLRFGQQDPMGYINGLDVYLSYADNPINGTDPTGLWKQVGSKTDDRATWESEGTDKIADLADKVKLSDNIDEIHHWLQGGTIHFQYRKDTATPSTLSKNDRFAPVCPGQKFTVPNVWIAGNLLQGGNLYNRVVNLGGTIGMLGTDLGVQGKKVVKATTFGDLLNVINKNSGNIWGIVIFGHGGKNGFLGNAEGNVVGTDYGSQGTIIDALNQGFRLSQSWAMQCYGGAAGTDGRLPNNPPTDWAKEWSKVSLDPHVYIGLNVLGIDLGPKS